MFTINGLKRILQRPKSIFPIRKESSGSSSRRMTSFTIPNDSGPTCKVSLCEGLTEQELTSHKPFKQWLETLQANLRMQWKQDHPFYNAPYQLHSIEIQAIDRFGHDRIGFIKFQAVVKNDNGETLPGAVFLRGGSVAMLILLQPDDTTASSDDELYTILTLQPRVAAGSLAFSEIPAGMIDDSGTFSGAAAKEIKEETGLEVREDELVDLTALAAKEAKGNSGETLKDAIYPSPGACDEFIPIFLCRKKLPRKELDELQGKLTGLRDEGEKITLKILKASDLWKEGFRDGKTLSAWALYSCLRSEGKI